MAVLVAFVVGMVFWITAWAFGWKAFDAFMVTIFLTVSAQAAHMLTPFIKQLLGREPESKPERPYF
jgi:hypothetical protein